jgi:acetyl-CoA carboxylase carboxyl transferase subunit alpha
MAFGVIDGIIAEPMGGAHHDPTVALASLGATLRQGLTEVMSQAVEARREARYHKYRRIGAFGQLSSTEGATLATIGLSCPSTAH